MLLVVEGLLIEWRSKNIFDGKIFMKTETSSFKQIRDKTEKVSSDPQERNKLWWNALPMTYSDWDAVNRIPETAVDFCRIEKD